MYQTDPKTHNITNTHLLTDHTIYPQKKKSYRTAFPPRCSYILLQFSPPITQYYIFVFSLSS